MNANRTLSKSLIGLFILTTAGICLAKEPVLTYRGNNLRNGRTTNVTAAAPSLLWKFRTDASIDASPVIGSDGTIYLASSDGRLYALTQLGGLKWSFQAEESIFSTPAVSNDGTIYFGDLAGNYYSLNPDGTRKWTYRFSEGTDRRITASPVVDAGGTSYIPSWNDQLCAITAEGTLRWCARLKGMLSSSPALDPDGNVYISGQDAEQPTSFAVYRFAPGSSARVWKFSAALGTDRNRAISTPAIDPDRKRLYAGVTGDANGVLFQISLSDGRLVRRIDFPRGILSSPALGPDGTVYVGSLDGRLYAVNPDTGEVKWQFKTAGDYIIGSPTVDGAGNICVGDSDGIVYGLLPSGKELWRFSTQSNVASGPAIGTDGKIFITSYDSHLYALGDAAGDNVFYFPQIADGTSGDAVFRTTLFFANAGSDGRVKVEFFCSTGGVMPVLLGNLGTDWSFTIDLKAGESFSAQTRGDSRLNAGYAKVTAGPGIGGTAVYSYSERGVILFEAGVPASGALNRFTLFVDAESPARATAFALVNTGMQNARATLRLYDTDFRHLADKTVESIIGSAQGPGSHLARYAWEIFPEIGRQLLKQGVITVESDQPLACVTLQQNDNAVSWPPGHMLNMSAFPVMPETAESNPAAGNAAVLYFPQIAAGRFGTAQVETGLVLVNTGAETDARIEFFDEAGQPSRVELRQEASAASSYTRHLMPGQSVLMDVTGAGTGWVGYARVTTTSRVGGTAVLKWSEGSVQLFEAGIPATAGQREFSVVVDANPNYSTGLAFVNTGSGPASVTLRLYDRSARIVAEKNLADLIGGKQLAPGAHFSKYAFEIFKEMTAQGFSLGMIAVSSDQPLAAVTLRQRDDPGKDFPDDIFLMSFFPVIPGAPGR